MSDDAFITFRYARNWATGAGPVFNPGAEAVEGYTSFLHVALLACLAKLGWAPHLASNWISAALALATWTGVVFYCRARFPAADPESAGSGWTLLVPALWLAVNRTSAAWATGGLETQIFATLVTVGTLLAVDDVERERERWWPLAAVMALASLTRPDGLLYAFCLFVARGALECAAEARRAGEPAWTAPAFIGEWNRKTGPRAATGAMVFLSVVGAHLMFRRAFYDSWLPNTYHAKLDGRGWWEMGRIYFAAFALEYGVVVWLPLALAGAWALAREGRPAAPLLIAAATVPHALYIAYCGGDNFEYRHFSTYMPLLSILLCNGARAINDGWSRKGAAAASLAALAATALLPFMTTLDFPTDYRSGFPGKRARDDGSTELIDSRARPWLFAIPGVGAAARRFNGLYARLTAHFVGIRIEEQRIHVRRQAAQGLALRGMIRDGLVPADARLALMCVGAVPYYSDLFTIDQLGLTDGVVARQPMPANEARIMAHSKMATPEYLAERGVELKAAGPDLLLSDRFDLRPFIGLANQSREGHWPIPMYISRETAGGWTILAEIPDGEPKIAARFPKLGFEPAWSVHVGEPKTRGSETDPAAPIKAESNPHGS